jgi:hypothetical protein
MTTVTLRLTMFSPWHMGSGIGEGAYLDAVPVKTPAGLPYIPGRSLKGLLREAVQSAEEFGRLEAGTTLTLFGSRDDTLSRYETTPGLLRFGSATLVEVDEAWARENGEKVVGLYLPLASTRIDADGIAHDHTLHKIEAALPVLLSAEVSSDAESADWVKSLRLALPLVRRIGSHRHRGLGRVQISILEVAQ